MLKRMVGLISLALTVKSRSTREVGMRIGSLVKGEVNRCIGVVTEVLQCEHQLRPNLYKVYWVALQLRSTIWIRNDELEIICK